MLEHHNGTFSRRLASRKGGGVITPNMGISQFPEYRIPNNISCCGMFNVGSAISACNISVQWKEVQTVEFPDGL